MGMSKRAYGEEYGNCLDGLRELHTFTRRRDWNVKARVSAAETTSSSSGGGAEVPLPVQQAPEASA